MSNYTRVQQVTCPRCGADSGEPCRAGTGYSGLPISRRGARNHHERIAARANQPAVVGNTFDDEDAHEGR